MDNSVHDHRQIGSGSAALKIYSFQHKSAGKLVEAKPRIRVHAEFLGRVLSEFHVRRLCENIALSRSLESAAEPSAVTS